MAKQTTTKQTTTDKPSRFKAIKQFFTCERTRFITGLVVFLVTLYMGVALISFFFPLLSTVHVVVIKSCSFSAALPLFDSWNNLRNPETNIIIEIIMTVTGFFSFDGTQIISVKLENTARKIRIMEKGFIKLLNILLKRLSFFLL